MRMRHGEPRARGLNSSAPCNIEHDQSDPTPCEPRSSNSEHQDDAEDAARARAADTLLRSKQGLTGSTCDDQSKHQSKRRRKDTEPQHLRDEPLRVLERPGAGSSREVGGQRQHNILSHRNFRDEETHTRIQTGQPLVHQRDLHRNPDRHMVHHQGYRISENERHKIVWNQLFAVVPREYHGTVEWCKTYSHDLLTDRVKKDIQINVQAKEIIAYAQIVERYRATASAHDSKVAEMEAKVKASEAKAAAAVAISEAKVAAAVAISEAKVAAAEAKVENANKTASDAENRATIAELELRRALPGADATGAPSEDTRVTAITAGAVQLPSCPAPTEGTSDLGAHAIPRQDNLEDRLTPHCMKCDETHAAGTGVFLLCGNDFCDKGIHMSCAGYGEEPEYWYCCPECEEEDLKEFNAVR